MCIAAPGRVIKVEGHKVTVQYPGVSRIALVGEEKVGVGDYVLVQMGIVIKVLTPEEAMASMDAWKRI